MQEAKQYLTPERIERGWSAVYCFIVDKEHEWPEIRAGEEPVAIVEDWPNDNTPLGIVALPSVNLKELGVGTLLYKSPQKTPKPTVPDNSQEWEGMDGCIAWHLIERHADNWSDVGKMMSEWLEANKTPTEAIYEAWLAVGADVAGLSWDSFLQAIASRLPSSQYARQQTPPPPPIPAPPECTTQAEKTAYAFGWWKALETLRNNPSTKDKP